MGLPGGAGALDQHLIEVFRMCNIPTVILLFYDYLLTLDMEVRLIWNPVWFWRWTSCLYLLVRYMPFVDAVFVLLYATALDDCRMPYLRLGWWAMAGIMIAEVLLTVHVCAAWNNEKRIICFTAVLFCSVWGLIFYWMHRFQSTANWDEGTMCINIGPTIGVMVIWCGSAVYDFILFTLLTIPALNFFHNDRRKSFTDHDIATKTRNLNFSSVFFSNGLGFYVVLIALAITNASAPGHLIQILSVVHRLSISILSCRMVLHIRQESQAENDQDSFDLSPMGFRTWSTNSLSMRAPV